MNNLVGYTEKYEIEADDVLDNTENFVEIELKSDPHVKSSHNLS